LGETGGHDETGIVMPIEVIVKEWTVKVDRGTTGGNQPGGGGTVTLRVDGGNMGTAVTGFDITIPNGNGIIAISQDPGDQTISAEDSISIFADPSSGSWFSISSTVVAET